MRLLRSLLLAAFLCAAILQTAVVAEPKNADDPGVTLELTAPAAGSKFFPGDRIDVAAKVGDQFALVRRVFIRMVDTKTKKVLNADREAMLQAGEWRMSLNVPASLPSGRYALEAEVIGDGDNSLQWTSEAIEITPARFALNIVSPAPNAAFHRNENFDVVAQIDDPKHKARRVFIQFEDPRKNVVMNGNREAEHRGNLWSQHLWVPATASPGSYRITVDVYGEGMQLLGTQKQNLMVGMAPVSMSSIQLEPAAKIRVGDEVKVSTSIDDPRSVVRSVVVSCTTPEGKKLLNLTTAQHEGGRFTQKILIDDDQTKGTYTVEFRAIGMGGEIIATRSLPFEVLPAQR
jgi:methionine-rich copper-binding protein CopC